MVEGFHGRNCSRMKKECWAASLGDCGGGISREHLVSQSFFPEGNITVQGRALVFGGA